MNPRLLLVIPILLAALGAHAQVRTTDPLAPLAQCINRGQFQYKTQERLPASATTRVVSLAAGERLVSTADGYRLKLFRRSSQPFANLKIERSAAGSFAADREIIVAQMQEMGAKGRPPQHLPLETDTRQDVEVLGLNNASIVEAPGIISFYTLLHAASGTVATAYLLNQPADRRDFATDAQYEALRTQLIASLVSCMADPAQ
jgi:hypothetical protein